MTDNPNYKSIASTGEEIKSNRIDWDHKHNLFYLFRYVSCPNKYCENDEHSQDADAARHKIEGYSYDHDKNNFACDLCGEISPSVLEFNEDGCDYLFPSNYTVILSAWDGNERFERVYKVQATTDRNAYAAAIKEFRRRMDAYRDIQAIHIATYAGHLEPIREGIFAYNKKQLKFTIAIMCTMLHIMVYDKICTYKAIANWRS